jgi:hypothetical protein
MKCWVVSHSHAASLGGRDVLGSNCTSGRLRARAGDFLALAVHSHTTVLVTQLERPCLFPTYKLCDVSHSMRLTEFSVSLVLWDASPILYGENIHGIFYSDSRFSDGGMQCTSGAEDAEVPGYKCTSRQLLPGCSEGNTPEVQCISGTKDAGVKKCAKSSLYSCL